MPRIQNFSLGTPLMDLRDHLRDVLKGDFKFYIVGMVPEIGLDTVTLTVMHEGAVYQSSGKLIDDLCKEIVGEICAQKHLEVPKAARKALPPASKLEEKEKEAADT